MRDSALGAWTAQCLVKLPSVPGEERPSVLRGAKAHIINRREHRASGFKALD